MSYLKSLPEGSTLRHVFRSFPETAEPLLALHEAVLRGPAPFTEGERELVAAYVSGLNACRYCYGIHTVTAEAFGVEEGLLEKLVDDLEAAEVEPRLRPVLRYARKLTETPARMTAADARAVFEAGWDDRALHFLAMTTALFNFMNRMVEGHGLKGDAAYAQEAGLRLMREGYGTAAGAEPSAASAD